MKLNASVIVVIVDPNKLIQFCDDNSKGYDAGLDDNNTLTPIGQSEGEHATGTAAKSTFPVTVSRDIIGLVANKMYGPVCDQQAGHREQPTIPTRHEETEIADAVLDDCDDDPNNDHVYNNRDDFYNLQQTSEDNGYGEQPADTEEDTTETSNDQRGAERDDNSTPRSIGDPKNIACEHATGTAAESTFPVTVSRNIIGLVGNTMYAPACDQQAGHSEQPTIPTRHEETEIADAVLDDCDDDPNNDHVYNNRDDFNSLQHDDPDNHIYNNRDDFNSLQQASGDNGYGDQPADKEEDTKQTINDQKDASVTHHKYVNHTVSLDNRTARDDNQTANGDNHAVSKYNHAASLDNHTARGDNQTNNGDNHTISSDNHSANRDNQNVGGFNQPQNCDNHPVSHQSHAVSRENQVVSRQYHTASRDNHTAREDNQPKNGDNHAANCPNHVHAVSRDNHADSLDNHAISRHNHAVSRHNHAVSRHNHDVSRHNHAFSRDNHTDSCDNYTDSCDNHTARGLESRRAIWHQMDSLDGHVRAVLVRCHWVSHVG
ncbi:PREDICTED: protein PFC0760c-like [Branchiostoma belcheri]|uniref:Protein PFC0760c-like n=1 Tax=Branchiostoma belcheri TaxID=7741 RepID=A0A6P4ZNN3_BRABE|nr:PREDICTED: protein PFC0760c-like [Branchiostoma belcheri]